MKHSTGKWGLHPLDEFLIIADEPKRDIYNRPIAKIDMGYLDHKNEPEANAKLIAAAPELLEALNELNFILRQYNSQGALGNDLHDAWNKSKQAIKKATI